MIDPHHEHPGRHGAGDEEEPGKTPGSAEGGKDLPRDPQLPPAPGKTPGQAESDDA